MTFATPMRAVGFDSPGNVRAIWKRPVVGMGTNQISALLFAACK